LRKGFGPKRDDVTGEWRKFLNEELLTLYLSQNIIRLMKSRRIRWAGNVARIGEVRKIVQCFGGKTKKKETTRKT
jgi:hypothetical protein